MNIKGADNEKHRKNRKTVDDGSQISYMSCSMPALCASDYGYVISSMKVDRLYDEWASSEE